MTYKLLLLLAARKMSNISNQFGVQYLDQCQKLPHLIYFSLISLKYHGKACIVSHLFNFWFSIHPTTFLFVFNISELLRCNIKICAIYSICAFQILCTNNLKAIFITYRFVVKYDVCSLHN